MSFFSDFKLKHEALKKRIHAYRLPLGPGGRFVMGIVYFSIPVVGGYYLMQYVNSIAEENLKDFKKVNSIAPPEVKVQNDALNEKLKGWKIKTGAAAGAAQDHVDNSPSEAATSEKKS